MVAIVRAQVIEKIRQIYPAQDAEVVLALLDRYGGEVHHRERPRVQMAILKLCDEEARLDPTPYVEAACADYRDVLAWAESPNLFKSPQVTDPEEREKLIAADEAHYLAWLEGR